MIAALLLAATVAVTPEAAIETFLGEVKAGRPAQAYALMRDEARKAYGEAQIAAYVESRRRVLGNLVEFGKPRPAKEVEQAQGLSVYEIDLTFQNGKTKGWFVMADEKLSKFAIDLPAGKTAKLEDSDVLPVVKDLLAYAGREGAAAMADRFSDEMLAAVEQDREGARAILDKAGSVLGPAVSYDLGPPTLLEHDCREVKGRGKFQHGDATVTVHICWTDGVWNVKHVQMTPQLTPVMVERMFALFVQGTPKVECPRDAAFPVGADIVCRVEVKGQPPQNATIRRTTESGWEIVGLAEAK
jgi:hypothetical protein